MYRLIIMNNIIYTLISIPLINLTTIVETFKY